MPASHTHEVIIVGGGPVGMGLAIELGQRGIRVAVVERYAAPQPVPKGQNLTQRTMEHFHFWGCEDDLRSRRIVPRDVANGGMVCYGTLLGDYRHDWLPREKVGQFYFSKVERLPQYETEASLRARAAQIDCIETFYGWTGDSFDEDAEGVAVQIRQHKGDATKTLRGQYLVGSDGSNSRTRDNAGIHQTKSDHDRLMVLLVFRSTQLHELLSRFPTRSFYNAIHPDMEGYWKFLGRVDLGTTWFFHAPVPSGTTSDNFDFTQYLHSAVGQEFPLEIDYVGFWDMRVAIADTYRKGRVLIAGDAAHSHPPYGGYGINTGFEDAANLGWKLAAVLQGWANDSLLDTYDEERRPVFASTASDFIERFIEEDRDFLKTWDPAVDRQGFEEEWEKRSQVTSEVTAFEPNYDGSSIVFGAKDQHPGARGSHVFEARSGHHIAPALLTDGRNTYDALGSGFTLFDFTEDGSIGRGFATAAQALKLPLNIVHDLDGPAGQIYQAGAVLVRPDQFVAWTGDQVGAEPEEILSKVIGNQ